MLWKLEQVTEFAEVKHAGVVEAESKRCAATKLGLRKPRNCNTYTNGENSFFIKPEVVLTKPEDLLAKQYSASPKGESV